MRVLVIDEEIPLPLNTGKRLRTFNLLKQLAGRHELLLVSRYHEGMHDYDRESFEQAGMKSLVVPHPIRKKTGVRFYGALAANLISPEPYSATSQYSKPYISALKKLLLEEDFDVLHCENIAYARNIEQFHSIPSVLVAHNLETMIWKRRYEVENNILRKVYTYFQWKKMDRYERKAFRWFDHIVAVSGADRDLIAGRGSDATITVIENGVDTDYFTASAVQEKPFSLVFTGSLDWFPNEDCMIYFLGEIWPRVLKKFPACTLTIVGRNPGNALAERAAGHPSVRLTGTVEDVRPFIDEAAVYVVPLRVGGGSRLKILEAFSMNKPVVSTSIGAEGLDVQDRRELIIADSPGDFADALGEMFIDQRLRESLAENGRSLVLKQYRWESLAEKLEQVWLRAAAGKN